MFTLLCLSDDLSTIQKAVQQFTESLQSLVKKEETKGSNKRKDSAHSRPRRINIEQTRFYRALRKQIIENNTELTDSKPKSMHTVFKLWNSDGEEDSISDLTCDSKGDMSYTDKHGVTCDSSCTLGETDWSMTTLDSSNMLSDNDSEVSEGRRYRESDTRNSHIWDVNKEQYILESEVHLTESGSSSCDTDFKIDLVEPNDFMKGLVRKESYAVPYQ